ncbi:MAG: class I SAM-dependent methyltransferase [Pyrinomonadaceae bacterium]
MDYVDKLKRVLPRRVHPILGKVRRRLLSLSSRTRRQKQDLLGDPGLHDRDRELLRLVESRISSGDGMYAGDGAQYFKVGLSAIRCIEGAMDAAGITSPGWVLDLPCGHGRVLRYLIQRFPDSMFAAADVDRRGVDFCARMFGASGIYAETGVPGFSSGQQFDLIWCGSLVTHLDKAGIHGLLESFERHLLPGGLVILTAHGDRAIQKMLNREFDYGVAPGLIQSLISSYREDGFGFADYPGYHGYGVSLSSPDWIRGLTRKFGLNEVYFRAHGWDDHQDVYGLVKPNASVPINP